MFTLIMTLFLACFQISTQASEQKVLDESEVVRNENRQITEVCLYGDVERMIAKLRALAEMSQTEAKLDAVSISHAFVIAEVVDELRQFDKLRCLRIGGDGGAAETIVEKEAYEKFAQLRQLQELYIVDAEYLKSSGGNRHITDVSFLRSLVDLRVLRIDANIEAKDLVTIAELPALYDFTYCRDAGKLPNEAWNKLLHNPALRLLDLPKIGPGFSPSNAFQDSASIKLQSLYLGYVDSKTEWTMEDIQAIVNLSNLRVLHLPKTKPISQEQLTSLVPCEDIKEIAIFVSDKVKSLPFLGSSRKLEKLIVFAPGFDAFGDMAGHPTLAEVTIEGECDPSALHQLRSVPSLKRLTIIGGNEEHANELRNAIPTIHFEVQRSDNRVLSNDRKE